MNSESLFDFEILFTFNSLKFPSNFTPLIWRSSVSKNLKSCSPPPDSILSDLLGVLINRSEDDIVVLKAGDYFNIGAHVKHRVEWTDSTCETIWLAVYY